MLIKVGLLGFGRTGSLVAKEIVTDPELELCWVCRNNIPINQKFASHSLGYDDSFAEFINPSMLNDQFLISNPVDLVIDFSAGISSAHYQLFAKHKIRIVTAISKYSEDQMSEITEASTSTSILASPNITLGINWLLIASKVLKKIIPLADVEIVEEHFKDKQGMSGTAIKIAKALDIGNEEIKTIRAGGIVGKHEVIFGFPYQTVRLIHESISREAFGNGALFVAQNLGNKKAGLYNFEDVLLPYFAS